MRDIFIAFNTVLLSILISLNGCGEQAPNQAAKRETKVIPVRVANVFIEDKSLPITASGIVASQEELKLAFKMGGVISAALDMDKMTQYRISLRQLSSIIQANNMNIPGGDLDAGTLHFSLKTSGGYKSIDELKNTVVSAVQGKILYVKDLADVYFDYEDPKYMGRYNGQRAIFISANQKEGKNILQVGDDLKKEVEAFKKSSQLGSHLKQPLNKRQRYAPVLMIFLSTYSRA